jgi:hypothetical protein
MIPQNKGAIMTSTKRQDLGVWDAPAGKFKSRIVEVKSRSFLIESLLMGVHGAQTTKWLDNVVDAVFPNSEFPTKQALKADLDALRALVPDAHLIDHEERRVIAYEIEDGNPLPAAKLRAYLRCWFALDDFNWELIVIRFSKDGIVSTVDFQASIINQGAIGHVTGQRH